MAVIEATLKARGRLRRGASNDSTYVYFRPRPEAARERDTLRHLHAWIDVHQPTAIHRNAFPTDTTKPVPSPEPCNDAGLAAFAQLCAHRLNVGRVLVTLMSGSVEYVLVDMTRTLPLMYDAAEDPNDALWLGTCSFPRTAGINGSALDSWRKARRYREVPTDPTHYYTEGSTPHYAIASDIRKIEESGESTLVKHAPWLRFTCSIPLRDTTGSVIGSLTLLDNKPRYGVSMPELLFLEDSADNIAEHLQACVVRSQRQRSERLIQALGLFNNHKSSLREWWVAQDKERLERGGRHIMTEQDREHQKTREDEEFGTQNLDKTHDSVANRRKLRRQESHHDEESTSRLENETDATSGNRIAGDGLNHAGVVSVDFGSLADEAASQSADSDGNAHSGTDTEERPSRQWKHVPRSTKILGKSRTFDAGNALQYTYARATNLIREALKAEGVVCVDARAASSSITRVSTKDAWGSSSTEGVPMSSSDTDNLSAMENGTSDTDASEDHSNGPRSRNCKVLGFSTREKSSIEGMRAPDFNLKECDLRRLIRLYPNGKIFNFEDSGDMYSSSGDESMSGSNTEDQTRAQSSSHSKKSRHKRHASELGKVMAGARTIALFPIKDDSTNGWGSCLFVWSTTPMRFFDPEEDITYLSTFAHCLLAELSRLETLASDKAKSSFISSMSHELRSPLHGVMAGVELLQDTELTPFQQEMASTVAIAGRTLLDTVNHILDYSKISKLTRQQRSEETAVSASRHDAVHGKSAVGPEETLHVDLARLTEEVVETVVAGHRYLGASENGRAGAETVSRRTESSSLTSQPAHRLPAVSVTLDIAKADTWMTALSPGAWTRILTNIVGNSLKYTQTGIVAVELSQDKPRFSTVNSRSHVTLTVTDSGIGMSAAYIENDLYTPFKQANAHSSGTGLGLSIVKQIAKELRAELDVSSELGKGTIVRLTFPLHFEDTAESNFLGLGKTEAQDGVSGQHFHLLTDDTKSQSNSATAVASSVLRNAQDWLGCTISSGSDLDMVTTSEIVAISERYLLEIQKTDPDVLGQISACLGADGGLVVLGSSWAMSSGFDDRDLPMRVAYLKQPIGPRRLFQAVQAHIAGSPALPDSPAPHATPRPDGPGVLHAHENGAVSKHSGLQTGGSFPWHTAGRNAPRTSQTAMRPGMPPRQSTMSRQTLLAQTSEPQEEEMASPIVMTPSVLVPSAGTPPPSFDGYADEMHATVMLVEDNGVNMKILVALMKKLKLPYVCAVNGLEALTIYTTTPDTFFLILCDIDMFVNRCTC
jgi:signal transduction histidine kinase